MSRVMSDAKARVMGYYGLGLGLASGLGPGYYIQQIIYGMGVNMGVSMDILGLDPPPHATYSRLSMVWGSTWGSAWVSAWGGQGQVYLVQRVGPNPNLSPSPKQVQAHLA